MIFGSRMLAFGYHEILMSQSIIPMAFLRFFNVQVGIRQCDWSKKQKIRIRKRNLGLEK